MDLKTDKHLFALYLKSDFKINKNFLYIHDDEIVRRIKKIVRLAANDSCIFFTNTHIYNVILKKIDLISKKIEAEIVKTENPAQQNKITVFLPLLEKGQMEEAFYSIAQQSISDIYIIKYAKSDSLWGSKNDYERAERIMIAAAEQSKSCMIPILHSEIINFTELKWNNIKNIVVIDTHGQKAFDCIEKISSKDSTAIFVGPEGGFAENEKEILNQKSFITMRLSKTILRSCDAIALSLGIIRAS